MLGLGLGLTFRPNSSSAPAFDPATLALTGWWRGSYAGSPWVGTASAGASGSRDLTEAVNPPTAASGSDVNGYTPATFDGTNDLLGNAGTDADFIAAGAYSIAVLFNADTAGSDFGASAPYEVAAFVTGTGGGASFAVGYSTSGVRAGHNASGSWDSAAKAASTGAWHLAIVTFDGTNLKVWVDDMSGGAEATAAMGNVSTSVWTLRVGANYSGAWVIDGKVMELITAQSAFDLATRNNIKSYVQARYPAMGIV